eukprot:scaffold47039_cov62-Cyclotella_meneghiniana.AAC.2
MDDDDLLQCGGSRGSVHASVVCFFCSGTVRSGWWKIHAIPQGPAGRLLELESVMPARKDSPHHSNKSIGSGCGWQARIGRDRHSSSGYGLIIVVDESKRIIIIKVVRAADDVGPQKPP